MTMIGLVVPTLGQRPDYLQACLESIRANEPSRINLVAPEGFNYRKLMDQGLIDQFTLDPGGGLAKAINAGIKAFDSSIAYVSWLGDDDLLERESLEKSVAAFKPGIVAVFGNCSFIDANSRKFWELKSGQWAVGMLSWGPNKVPQPGSLLLREAVEGVGYLDENLGWAFDQDLFLKLRSSGKLKHIPQSLASFRWHDASLSAGESKKSLKEASNVRLKYARPGLRSLCRLREELHVFLASSVTASLDRRQVQ